MLEPVSERRQTKTTFLVSSVKKLPFLKLSPMDESLRWTEYLALLELNGAEVHQGRKKKNDGDIGCMGKLQKFWMLESVSKLRQAKTNFLDSSVKNWLFLNYPPWMNHWDEQSNLPS